MSSKSSSEVSPVREVESDIYRCFITEETSKVIILSLYNLPKDSSSLSHLVT